MSTNAFTSLANLRLHLPGRLLSNSCCPDKDLVLLFSRLGGTDRMSLWNSNQGSKIWETDVGDGNDNCNVSGIAWSPDGQSIAVIQDPPAISLHSLQDGRSFLSLPISLGSDQEKIAPLTGIWWFKDEKDASVASNIPDIFKRGDIITGSALSILKILPLLDSLQEENEKLTATDIFAFQGSHTRSNQKTQLPPVIDTWPTLSADHLTASISASTHNKPTSDGTILDEIDSSNINSILLVTDSAGQLFSYLDGTFPLGFISLGSNVSFSPAAKHPERSLFVGQPRITRDQISRTRTNHMVVDFPLLARRQSRDLAKLSTAARELAWYALRVVKEMREVWYGSDSNSGARELGPKWVSMLESKQREQFGQSETNPILDLTYLLTTGRASDALLDLLGSGEQMSERGIQKWESTVTDALVKLRDSAEKRAAPALQRLHLILDEIQGWSKLPQFASFNFASEEITIALNLASRGIIITSWLAAISRTELSRFREFVSWLRFEVNTVNSPNDGNIPRHDILEVNNYFATGLASSVIDDWFIGPTPQFQSVDLGLKDNRNVLVKDACEEALRIAMDPSQMAWQTSVPRTDLSHLGKNIEALVQELAQRSQRLFHNAAGAASRSALVSFDSSIKSERLPEKALPSEESLAFPFRERTILGKERELIQYTFAPLPSDYKRKLFLTKLRLGVEPGELPAVPGDIRVALLECYLPEEDEEESDFDILDADFFDDESVVLVYRLCQGEKQAYIATLNYDLDDIGYQKMSYERYVKGSDREDLMQDALELWKSGQLSATSVPINRRRALSSCKTGGVSLALNGRTGRRVACVLDCTGTTLESFDLEGDAEDMEVADDARAG